MKYVSDEMIDKNVEEYFRIQDMCSSTVTQIQDRFCELIMNIQALEEFNNDFEVMKWEVNDITSSFEHEIDSLISKYFV